MIEVVTSSSYKAQKGPSRKSLVRKPSVGPKKRKLPAKGRTKVSTKKPLRSKLTKEADRLVSIYVRNLYAKDGMVECYTCDGVYPVKKIQCGHYIPRGYRYTRWELDNLRPQCFMCNCRYYGQSFIFRRNLVAELGEERVAEMERIAKVLFHEKDDYIQAIINRFRLLT